MSGKCLWLEKYCKFWRVDCSPDGAECIVADLADCRIEQMANEAKDQNEHTLLRGRAGERPGLPLF